jgi:hypothetical protein
MKRGFEMKKSEVTGYEDAELLNAFYWVAVRTTNEVNSKRGLTKGTKKEELLILEEMAKRFNIDLEKLRNGIVK